MAKFRSSIARFGWPALLAAAAVLWFGAMPSWGQTLDATPAPKLEETKNPERCPRHAGRAILETAGILAGGLVWYWRDLEFNTRDWDLHWDRASWKRKLLTLDALRFDQNLFQTNAVSHSRAGLAHYQVLRGNGIGAPASIAGTLGIPHLGVPGFFLRSRPTLFARGMGGALSPWPR